MSGAAVMGLVTAGVTLGVLGISALSWRRDNVRLRTIRAHRWAKEADLALPPESVEPLAAKVRREALVDFALMTLIGAPVFGLTTWRYFATSPGTGGSLLHGPEFPLIGLTVSIVVNALGQVCSRRQEERTPGERIRRPQPVTLAMAVPPWATWLARALAVVSPLAALTTLHGVPGTGLAHTLSPYACTALLAAAVLAQYGVERRQTAILNRSQQAGSLHQLAFDDAFRVRAVLELVPMAPTLSYLANTLILQYAYSSANRAQPQLALTPLETWWLPLGMAVFFFNIALNAPGVRRYYRRGWAPPQSTLPPPPDTPAGPC